MVVEMKEEALLKKFINFFQKRSHYPLSSSSLIPDNDSSILFTTAGMQQFKDYFSGAKQSPYKRIATIQKCFRTSDIDKVGDENHLTFFEMLGNFSFGDYFKKETIAWALEFLIKELDISKSRISANYFGGDKELIQDEESFKELKKFNIQQINKLGREDTFWGPTGVEGSCGPAVEILVDGIEVWTLVFNEFYKDKFGRLRPLLQKGVDTGMGLERILAVVENNKNVFETELFTPILKKIEEILNEKYLNAQKEFRTIADHIRGICFLISSGVVPSNVQRGYVLRRLIRRANISGFVLGKVDFTLQELVNATIEIYQKRYKELDNKKIIRILSEEESKFKITLRKGISKIEKSLKNTQRLLDGQLAFMLYDTYGLPLEITQKIAEQRGIKVDTAGFEKLMRQQKERARKAGEQKKKQMASLGQEVAKNHTATHLLHQALRDVLGNHVRQMGQDLTVERLRFDFTHPKPLTEEEKEKVEKIINKKINESLPVVTTETTLEEAKKQGAIALFEEKYSNKVILYKIGDYSKELCAGPHVKNTSEIGQFKIISEKSAGAGVRRIKAITF